MSELGDYLRNRRALVSPGEVGLASVGRRRVPRLRREEGGAVGRGQRGLLHPVGVGPGTVPSAPGARRTPGRRCDSMTTAASACSGSRAGAATPCGRRPGPGGPRTDAPDGRGGQPGPGVQRA